MGYRAYTVLSKYFKFIAVLLVAVSAFGGYMAYQDFKPHYTTVTRNETLYSYQGGYTHEAEVAETNPVWPVGTTLRNRPVYFRSIMPRLGAGFYFRIRRASDTSGTLHVDSDLLIRTTAQEEAIIWEKTTDMREKTFELSGDTATLDFEVYIPEVENTIDNIEDSLGYGGGTTTVQAITDVTINGVIDGKDVSTRETYEMPIELGGSTYSVGDDLSSEETVTETHTEETRTEVPVTEKATSIAVIAAPLLVLGYLAFARSRIDMEEIESLREEKEFEEFDEWISKGRLPDLDVKASIDIESLEDLVDLAIDLNRRVIYDAEKSTYYVLHEDLLYTYGGTEAKESKRGV